jgi:signal peptidase I, bacterial type
MDKNQPLQKYFETEPAPIARKPYPWLKDLIGLVVFIAIVILGAVVINALVFRSFSVVGPSMEDTLFTGERIIVNRLPVTGSIIVGKDYTPKRGQIIVFKNPQYKVGSEEEYIVKRVIAFAGETVDIHDCNIKVSNSENRNGFDPYRNFDVSNPNDCVSGAVDNYTVPPSEIFVIGDHRNGRYSHDSRDGIGNGNSSNTNPAAIPLSDVVGPVSILLSPLDRFKIF